MHYTTLNPLRLVIWPVWLLLAMALAACTQTTGNAEPAAPEEAPTDLPPTEAATHTAVPRPTDTAVPLPTSAPTTNLDEPFALAGDAETVVGTEGLTLHFERVLEDSRCPTQVDCVWSGQARILIVASQPGQEPVELEFNTNPTPDQTVDLLPAYGYTVQLIQLDPYPQTTDPILFADYRAQLVVTRNP
ncbi:MAG: hypothetical protein KJ069_26855 [Anaerolineae bacterium]|nr:hypothetical protein [Anaerolineae bacterium]